MTSSLIRFHFTYTLAFVLMQKTDWIGRNLRKPWKEQMVKPKLTTMKQIFCRDEKNETNLPFSHNLFYVSRCFNVKN